MANRCRLNLYDKDNQVLACCKGSNKDITIILNRRCAPTNKIRITLSPPSYPPILHYGNYAILKGKTMKDKNYYEQKVEALQRALPHARSEPMRRAITLATKLAKMRIVVLCLLLLSLSGCGLVDQLCDEVKWLSQTTHKVIVDIE